MWGIGYRLWRAWQYTRLAVPGGALAVLALFAQGPTLLFWLLAGGTVLVVLGARVVLTDLARREGVTEGRERRR
ncbi:hypothetical protein GCM10010484_39860 [Actinokineospora globicatena]